MTQKGRFASENDDENVKGCAGSHFRKGDRRVRLKTSPPSLSSFFFFFGNWEPRRLTNLWASTACYRDNFTFTLL
jgi:hypothetical protein